MEYKFAVEFHGLAHIAKQYDLGLFLLLLFEEQLYDFTSVAHISIEGGTEVKALWCFAGYVPSSREFMHQPL